MDDRTMQQQVAFLVRCLLEERKRTGGWLPPREPGADEPFGEQWDVFRALVNTREPYPAPEGFLAAQDALLRELVRRVGVTQVADPPPVAADARLSLWCGDITTLAADAIVNAANARMLGCWVPGHYCIDNAIHTFAGVQLRLECARLMDAQGYDEPTGRAKVTPAYNLPSRFVIHTVGPIAEGRSTDRNRLELASSYRSCLEAAVACKARSVAFCCISTGVFGFPQEEAAPLAVRTVRAWLDAHQDADLRVVFDVFGERDEGLYRALLS